MAITKTKLLGAFSEQIQQIEERCPGYRKELLSAVADIIQAERLHETHATNIQQKVSDICDRLGHFLDKGTEDNSQS